MKLLLDLFMVGVLHNIIHIASGIFGLAGSSSESGARLYLRGFGIVYALVTIFGFIEGHTVLGILPVNTADNFLHLFLTIILLGFGYAYKGGRVGAKA